jgi:hypothetical protein
VVAMHNIEESMTMQSWILKHSNSVPSQIKAYLPDFNMVSFADSLNFSLLIATIIPFLIVYLANKFVKNIFIQYLVIITGFVVILNSFQHMASGLYFTSYVPGLISSMFITLPFTFWLVQDGLNTYQINRTGRIILFLISILIYIPILLGIWNISTSIVKTF